MNHMLTPQGKIDDISLFVEQWGNMVRRHDERTGRQALTDDTQIPIMMDMCPTELGRHLVLHSDQYGSYPKVMPGNMEYVVHNRSDPVGPDEMLYPADDEHDGEWEEVYAVGENGGRKRKNTGKGKGHSKRHGQGPAGRTPSASSTSATGVDEKGSQRCPVHQGTHEGRQSGRRRGRGR